MQHPSIAFESLFRREPHDDAQRQFPSHLLQDAGVTRAQVLTSSKRDGRGSVIERINHILLSCRALVSAASSRVAAQTKRSQ